MPKYSSDATQNAGNSMCQSECMRYLFYFALYKQLHSSVLLCVKDRKIQLFFLHSIIFGKQGMKDSNFLCPEQVFHHAKYIFFGQNSAFKIDSPPPQSVNLGIQGIDHNFQPYLFLLCAFFPGAFCSSLTEHMEKAPSWNLPSVNQLLHVQHAETE